MAVDEGIDAPEDSYLYCHVYPGEYFARGAMLAPSGAVTAGAAFLICLTEGARRAAKSLIPARTPAAAVDARGDARRGAAERHPRLAV